VAGDDEAGGETTEALERVNLWTLWRNERLPISHLSLMVALMMEQKPFELSRAEAM
jgi:hypothetical protein